MKTMQEKIEGKLRNIFTPSFLEVVNESSMHSGHAGDDGSGESHFRVEIISDSFEGKRVTECHRMVYDCLKEEMKMLHALSICASQHKK